MRTLLFLFLSLICSLQCIAQGERNNWFFGDSAGVTFNSGSLGLLNNGTTRAHEACSSISDINGNLIFYANGLNTSVFPNTQYAEIWNKTNQPMQNSNVVYAEASMTQGQLILPLPSNSNQYFLFSIRLFNSPYNWSLYYSTIDMQLDSGRGAIVAKNILLCDTDITEKMTAVKHANGRDWWLFVHEFLSNNLFEYLITPAGISGPTVLSAGSCIGCNSTYDQGQMVFSKDGSKLCVANTYGILDVFDFDRCTGSLNLQLHLGLPYNALNGWTTFYGCSFSADGQVLYASRFDT